MPPGELHEPLPGTQGALNFTMVHTPRMKWLDKAAILPSDGSKAATATRTEVEETKAFLGIMPLFLCICM